MTENKRFWSEDYCVGYYTEIVDNDKELADVPNPKKNLTIEELVDMLNELHEENTYLKLELDTHKHPLWSTREAERKVSELTELLADEVKKNGELLEENNLLKIENKRLLEHRGFLMSKKCHICGKEVEENYYLDERGYTCYTCSKAIANQRNIIKRIKDGLND